MDVQASANSVDPDQTLQNKVSVQGLHCLQLIQHFRHINKKWTCSMVRRVLDKSWYQVNIFLTFVQYFSMKTYVVGTH